MAKKATTEQVATAIEEVSADEMTNVYVVLNNPLVGRGEEDGKRGFVPLGQWLFSIPGTIFGDRWYPVQMRDTNGNWTPLKQFVHLDTLREAVRIQLSDPDFMPAWVDDPVNTTQNSHKVMSVWVDMPSASLVR